MLDDKELLRQYSEERSEDAFREIVERHLPSVYSVALRRVGGDAHLAQDVTQRVFTDLARKSAGLHRHRAINGWLFVSARYAAAEAVRRERRRRDREHEAMTMQQIQRDDVSRDEWEHLRPGLDDLIDDLGERDREAVLLRFFQGLPFAEIGGKLGLSENAARMRVDRALEKLRSRLVGRGVKSTAGALAAVLANQSGAALPAGLAAAVTGSAAATSAAGGAMVLWQFISMNKITISAIAIVSAACVATSTGITRSSGAISVAAAPSVPTPAIAPQPTEPPPVRQPAGTPAATRDVAASAPSPNAAEPTAEVYDPSQLDRQPAVLIRVPPDYPFEAKRAGLKGEVTVDFMVDPSGDVRNATADDPPPRVFQQAALSAVKRWKFKPGIKGGRPVWTHLRVPIEFR